MNAQEREFLAASVSSSEREAVEREAQHQRELEAAQKLADNERLRLEEGLKSAHRLQATFYSGECGSHPGSVPGYFCHIRLAAICFSCSLKLVA